MATFSVRFLGCEVSYADAEAVRERLLQEPWLLDGDIGQLLPARTVGVSEDGILAVGA